MTVTAPRWTRGYLAVLAVVLLIVLARASGVPSYVNGAAFVALAAGMNGTARSIAEWDTTRVSNPATPPIPWRGGTLEARASQPFHATGRGIVLVPGVHAAGIDEPRLVGFARELAGMGHPVLTVELPDLAHYQITVRTT